MMSFDLLLYKLSEKLLLLTFNKGNKVFDSSMGLPEKNLKK